MLAVAGPAVGTDPTTPAERLVDRFQAGETAEARAGFDAYLRQELETTKALLGTEGLEDYRRLGAIMGLGWLGEVVSVWYGRERGYRCRGGETPDAVRRSMASHARAVDETLRSQERLDLARGADDPWAIEAGLRQLLETAFTVLAFEERLPPREALGPGDELRDLLASALATVHDRRSELTRKDEALYVAERSGQAAAAWLRVLSRRESRERLEEVFEDFRAELDATGIATLAEALEAR